VRSAPPATGLPFGNDINNPMVVPCSAPVNALQTNNDATEHHFTGKERDTESGNDYFDARYYSSAMGRFMSPDWSARIEPVPYMVLNEPQSLNLYAYVGNNPLTHTDPDGHACQTTTGVRTFAGQVVQTWSSRDCSGGLNPLEENLYRWATQGAHATAKAAQGLDWFNNWLGFGKTNCGNGGDCGDAAGQAFAAIIAGIDSDGLSEDANAAKIEAEIATLSKKWSKGTFNSLEDSLAYHFKEHGAPVGAKDLLQYLRKADGFLADLERGKGPTRRFLPNGTTRLTKNGRYIIRDAEGLIRSFGKARD